MKIESVRSFPTRVFTFNSREAFFADHVHPHLRILLISGIARFRKLLVSGITHFRFLLISGFSLNEQIAQIKKAAAKTTEPRAATILNIK